MSGCGHSATALAEAKRCGWRLPHCGRPHCATCLGKFKGGGVIVVHAVSGRTAPLSAFVKKEMYRGPAR